MPHHERYYAEADRSSQGNGQHREPHLDMEPHLAFLLEHEKSARRVARGCVSDAVTHGPRIRTQLDLECSVPADGTRAATPANGDLGTSPIFGQLSDKPLLACIHLAGVSAVKHNGSSRN